MPIEREKTFERSGVSVTIRVSIDKITPTTFDDIRACLRDALISTDSVEQEAVRRVAESMHDAQ